MGRVEEEYRHSNYNPEVVDLYTTSNAPCYSVTVTNNMHASSHHDVEAYLPNPKNVKPLPAKSHPRTESR